MPTWPIVRVYACMLYVYACMSYFRTYVHVALATHIVNVDDKEKIRSPGHQARSNFPCSSQSIAAKSALPICSPSSWRTSASHSQGENVPWLDRWERIHMQGD